MLLRHRLSGLVGPCNTGKGWPGRWPLGLGLLYWLGQLWLLCLLSPSLLSILRIAGVCHNSLTTGRRHGRLLLMHTLQLLLRVRG